MNPIADAMLRAGDDANAAILLLRIEFRMKGTTVERDGRLWTAHDLQFWSRDTRLSERQVRRAFVKLRQLGVIETKQMRYKGVPIQHVTVTENGQPTVTEIGQHGATENGQPYIEPVATPEASQQSVLSENTYASAGNDGQEPEGEEVKKPVSKPNPMKGKTAAEISALFQSAKSVVAPPAPSDTLDIIWKKAVASGGYKHFPKVTVEDVAKLKKIAKVIGREGIERVVAKWGSFCNEVKHAKGWKDYPSEPNIGFLLYNVEIAASMAKAPEPKSKSVPSAPPKAQPKEPLPVQSIAQEPDGDDDDAYVPATPEEVMAILNSED